MFVSVFPPRRSRERFRDVTKDVTPSVRHYIKIERRIFGSLSIYLWA
jgi:hypothetical protein